MTKQLARYSLAVMTTVLGLAILWVFRTVVVYVLISVSLAAALRPLFSRLNGRGAVERLGWNILYVFALAGFGYLLYLVGKTIVVEIQEFVSAASTQGQWILPSWLRGSLFEKVLVARLLPPSQLIQIATLGQAQAILPAIVTFTQGVASRISEFFIMLVMSVYWIINKSHFERLWLSLLPSNQRKQARDIWQTVEPDLGAYIRSQFILTLVAGILLVLGYWALGSPYPMMLALIGAFMTAIPYMGVILAVLIPLVLGLFTGGLLTAFLAIYTIIVLVVLRIWVKPRLFSERWNNPILTLTLIAALASAFGLVGILIAPPLSVVIQTLWNLLVNHRPEAEPAVQVADFKQRQESVWSAIHSMEEPPPPQVISTMERLTDLITRSEPILKETQREYKPRGSLPNPPATTQE